MKRTILLCSVVVSLCSPGGWAKTDSDWDIEIPYQEFTLDNGLTLIVHEDHKAPIVAVNVWYHVGSKNEKPGKTGFAHLFEHLMFNGSEHFDDDYFQAMERIGATDLNGTTSEDRTNYFQNVPSSAVDVALWLESDRMGHMIGAITQEKLDEQRGVVQNEKRQHENQPYAVADELITHSTFPAGHPYSWTVIGSMEDLDAASLDDVHTWFKTYYGAANAVLSIAGDITPAEALAKVKRYFGDIPAGPPLARQDTWIAKRSGTHRQEVQDRVPQARLYRVWNVPAWGSEDGDLLDLVSDILASGKTSRLYKRLVYDDQIATDVSAYVDLRGFFILKRRPSRVRIWLLLRRRFRRNYTDSCAKGRPLRNSNASRIEPLPVLSAAVNGSAVLVENPISWPAARSLAAAPTLIVLGYNIYITPRESSYSRPLVPGSAMVTMYWP